MAYPKIDVPPNVPVTGTLKYANYYKEKEKDGKTYGAQIGLVGTWDGKGEGVVYLKGGLTAYLEAAGIIQATGEVNEFGPKYQVIYKGRVTVTRKTIQGSRALNETVIKEGQQELYAEPGPANPPSKAAHPSAEPAPRAAPADYYNGVMRLVQTYRDIHKVYMDEPVWKEEQNNTAAVATMFIRADKMGLLSPSAGQRLTQEQVGEIDRLLALLNWSRETPEWISLLALLGLKNSADMTVKRADLVITYLEKRLEAASSVPGF